MSGVPLAAELYHLTRSGMNVFYLMFFAIVGLIVVAVIHHVLIQQLRQERSTEIKALRAAQDMMLAAWDTERAMEAAALETEAYEVETDEAPADWP